MPCEGSPGSCSGLEEEFCEDCGCDWDEVWRECEGSPSSCGSHGDDLICEDCGCDWVIPGPENVDINIADVWRDVELMYINIGDTWRGVVEVKINIGDVWRTVYIA